MTRSKIAITLKEDILKRLDRAVDGKTIRNRSHAIEYFLNRALSKRVEKALLVAGHNDFSCATVFEGKPVIEHELELLKRYGVKEVVFLLHEREKEMERVLGDGSERGVKITYLRQEESMVGTARALCAAKRALGEGAFFVMYCHVAADIDLSDFAAFHEASGAAATVALTSIEDPSLYGAVKMRGEKIVEFAEKPQAKEGVSRVISSGIFCFSREIFDYIPRQKTASLEKDVFPKLAKEGKLAGYMFEGKWCNVRNQICFPAKNKKK